MAVETDQVGRVPREARPLSSPAGRDMITSVSACAFRPDPANTRLLLPEDSGCRLDT